MKPQKEKPKPQSPALLDSQTVAEWLGVSLPTLSRMVHSNRIPFIILGTGKKKMLVRFKEGELEKWLDRRSRGAVPKSRTNLSDVDKRNGETTQLIETKDKTLFLETGVKTNSRLKSVKNQSEGNV